MDKQRDALLIIHARGLARFNQGLRPRLINSAPDLPPSRQEQQQGQQEGRGGRRLERQRTPPTELHHHQSMTRTAYRAA